LYVKQTFLVASFTKMAEPPLLSTAGRPFLCVVRLKKRDGSYLPPLDAVQLQTTWQELAAMPAGERLEVVVAGQGHWHAQHFTIEVKKGPKGKTYNPRGTGEPPPCPPATPVAADAWQCLSATAEQRLAPVQGDF
jgi:hypothetical protein